MLAVVLTLTGTPAMATPDNPGTDLAALADPARLVGTAWRTDLATTLAGVKELREDRAVSGPLAGQVLARTLRLPSRLELRGDTTIVAHHVVLEGSHVSLVANGHTLRLLPIDTLRTQTAATVTASGRAAVASTIRFEANGQDGMAGQSGDTGDSGQQGEGGEGGETVFDPSSGCYIGREGKAGKQGSGGGAGTGGTGGSQATSAGNLLIDIPDGSTDRYELIAHGGRGGAGGQGGQGGTGGKGGTGGTGGWGECPFFGISGGPGGQGGPGGNGGTGGSGGSGGDGGNGGNITVSYPEAYDSSLIFTDPSGGTEGGGGQGGQAGFGGPGGDGGQGGHGSNGDGNPGSPGPQGFFGTPGSFGTSNGHRGTDGTVQLTARGSVSLRINKTVYQTGDVPTYTVTGPPNSQIFWSSSKNGVPVEQDVFRGHVTNAQGTFTGTGPAWTDGDVSDNWLKSVRIGTRTAQASFRVVPAPPRQWEQWMAAPGLTVNGQIGASEIFNGGTPKYLTFARGADDGVYWNSYQWRGPDQGWYFPGWNRLDGAITSSPVVVLRPRAAFLHEMYARGTDGAIYRQRFRADLLQFQGWEGLGGFAKGRPAVVSQNPNQLMVFVRGSDDQLHVNQLTGSSWTGWIPLGGTLTADPTAAAHGWGGQYVTVVVRGAAGETNYRRWNGFFWEEWSTLGGWVAGELSAVTHDVNQVMVFGRGGGDFAYLNQFDGNSFTGWRNLGGSLSSDPVASATGLLRNDDQLHYDHVTVAARDTANRVTINGISLGQSWHGWQILSGETTRPVSVISLALGEYHVFASDPATGLVYNRSGFGIPRSTNRSDFDGDGMSEHAVYRPSNQTWFSLGARSGFRDPRFGSPGDAPVTGDFDGDRQTDLAVYRPSNDHWYWLRSSRGTTMETGPFGQAGDVLVPADYNGDGATDPAIWRPSTGQWFMLRTDGVVVDLGGWGGGGDIPVPGDYDCDGRADRAIWRPGDGNWWVIGTSTPPYVQQWGGGGDIPVPGDYNADGCTDFAVFRPSEGNWYVWNQFTQQWGVSTDIPVPSDYDGDGRTDVAIWRPGDGHWWWIRSSSWTGVDAGAFGGSTDIALPSFRRNPVP